MKKIISFLLIAVFAFVLFGCQDPEPEYTLEISADVTEVKVGKTINVYAETLKPNSVFEWSSSNVAIATVDSTGEVTGISEGTVDIIVSVEGLGEKKISITVLPKDYTAAELKTYLTTVYNEYLNSKNGSVKLVVDDSTTTLTSELMFNYTADKKVESLMYRLTEGTKEMHTFVKDGKSYILANGEKTQTTLTTQEQSKLVSDYGFAKFVEQAAAYFNENEFYSAVEYVKATAGVLEFKLNIASYNGNVFNLAGKESVKILVTLNNEKVTKVDTVIGVSGVEYKVSVHFLGTTVQTIPYPSDLDSYLG